MSVIGLDHQAMFVVLGCLERFGPSRTCEVAVDVGLEPSYVTVVLQRCSKRKLVRVADRYKLGREHGYVYELTEKGRTWLRIKASKRRGQAPRVEVPNDEVKESVEESVEESAQESEQRSPEPSTPRVVVKMVEKTVFVEADSWEPLKNLAFCHLMEENCRLASENAAQRQTIKLSFLVFKRVAWERDYWMLKSLGERTSSGALEEIVRNKREIDRITWQLASYKVKEDFEKRLQPVIAKLDLALRRIQGTVGAAVLQLVRDRKVGGDQLGSLCADAVRDAFELWASRDWLDRWWNTLPDSSGWGVGVLEGLKKKRADALKDPHGLWETVPDEVCRLPA